MNCSKCGKSLDEHNLMASEYGYKFILCPVEMPMTEYKTANYYPPSPALTAEQEAEVRRIVREELKPLFEKLFEQAIFWGDSK